MFEKGREKNKVEGQGIIRRRGEGLGTGKVPIDLQYSANGHGYLDDLGS